MTDRMPFGKYRHTPIVEIDDGYLRWVISDKCERADAALRSAVTAELQRRKALHPPDRSPQPTAPTMPKIDADLVITCGTKMIAAQIAGDAVRRRELDQVVASLQNLAAGAGLVEPDDDTQVPF